MKNELMRIKMQQVNNNKEVWIQAKYITYTLPENSREERKYPVLQQGHGGKKNVYVRYNGVGIMAETVVEGVAMFDMKTGLEKYPAIKDKIKKAGKLYPAEKKAKQEGTGMLIYIDPPTGTTVQLYLYASVDTNDSVDFARQIIYIAPHAEVDIFAENLQTDKDNNAISVLYEDIIVDEDASCSYADLVSGSGKQHFVMTKNFHIFRDAHFEYIDVTIGGKTVNKKVSVYLKEPGAGGLVDGVIFSGLDQIYETYAGIYNMVPSTGGKVLYHVAAGGESRVLFDGMIRIEPGAVVTDSYLEDHTLMLSDEARVESIPSLEIEADDVRASHGATMGSIDQEQLFYLMTRGISEVDAKKAITIGFLKPAFDRIKDEALKGRILAVFTQKCNELYGKA